MLETELKYRLTSEEEMTRLEAVLGEPIERLAQANRYWLPTVPPGVALRVREVGGESEATVKRAGPAPMDGLFIHEEETERLDAGTAVALLTGERPLEDLPLVTKTGLQGPFRYVGLLLTLRNVYRIDGLPVETDRVTFPDGAKEYEVEAEAIDADALRSELLALAALAGVSLRASKDTKLGRFLARERNGGDR